MNRGEIWGVNARSNGSTYYFNNKFELVGLVDIQPLNLKPTWSNKRVGIKWIYKRLDIFLVHGNFTKWKG